MDPTVLKRMDKNEEENMQPLLSLDWYLLHTLHGLEMKGTCFHNRDSTVEELPAGNLFILVYVAYYIIRPQAFPFAWTMGALVWIKKWIIYSVSAKFFVNTM